MAEYESPLVPEWDALDIPIDNDAESEGAGVEHTVPAEELDES